MDKFEEQIKAAQKAYEPKDTFIDATMQHIAAHHPRRRWSAKVWAPALAGVAVVALVLVALPISSRTIHSSNSNSTTTTASQTQPSTSTAQGSSNTTSHPSAGGTDNASLENDLGGVQHSMSQENNDQSSANSALNDQQNEIATPTS